MAHSSTRERADPAAYDAPPPTGMDIQLNGPAAVPAPVGDLDYGEDAGLGAETIAPEQRVTPFLAIVATNSPQLMRGDPKYLPDARAGMLFDTATGECFEALEVVVAHQEHHYGAWRPRDLGGGFRGIFEDQNPIVIDTMLRMGEKYGRSARFKMPKYRKEGGGWTDAPALLPGTGEEVELIETTQFYLLYGPPPISPAAAFPAIFRFKSTSLAVATGALALYQRGVRVAGRMVMPPLFAHLWELTSVLTENPSGKWFNPLLTHLPPGVNPVRDPEKCLLRRSDPLYAMARDFRAAVVGGEVRVEYDAAPDREPGVDDVPF
jgi:hypothetical protein